LSLRVLVIDDEPQVRKSLYRVLADEGYKVDTAESARAGVELVERLKPHIVILDLKLPDGSGLDVLKRISELDESIQTIVITAYAEVQLAVEAMKMGAAEFLKKPYELQELVLALKSVAKNVARERHLSLYRRRELDRFAGQRIVGECAGMREVWELVDKVARSDTSTVLVEGESGTGKELVARAIHYKSDRRGYPFMEVNCSSFQETLLENELFGHEKGAFTDARELKKGLVELADPGTLFLDEVADMPMGPQSKLLRFLENRTFKRVGGVEDLTVDIRVIGATNRRLEDAVSRGMFREDLFYRLKVVSIELPPLRERADDIILLAEHFMGVYSAKFGKELREVHPGARDLLLAYRWPGNVRELKNMIERIVLLEDGDQLLKEHLPNQMLLPAARLKVAPQPVQGECEGVVKPLAEVEKEHIINVLNAVDGNKSQAARLLGLSRQGLLEKLKRMEENVGTAAANEDRV
jgi:two-component system response regulator AtoC